MVRSKARAELQAQMRRDKEKTQGRTKVRDKEDERRRSMIAKRTVWPEKGIDLEELRPTFVPSVVRHWGWESVANQSLPYNEIIVREFYSMLAEYEFRQTGRVVVQGVEVVITSERINAFYGLPDLDWPTGLPMPADTTSFSTLARELRKSGRPGWDAKDDPVKHGDLNLEAAFWNKFASHSIRPARHIYTVPRKKMPLVFCLMQRRQIDLGKVIFLEMSEASAVHQDGMPILPFPGLISHFCQEAGIDVFAELRHFCPAVHPIDAISYNRLLKNHPEMPKLPTGRARERMEALADAREEDYSEERPPEGEPQQHHERNQHDPIQPSHLHGNFASADGDPVFSQAQPSVPPQNDQLEQLMKVVLEGQASLGMQLTEVKNTQTELMNRMSALQTQVVHNQTQTDSQLSHIWANSGMIMQRLLSFEDAVRQHQAMGPLYNYYQRQAQRQNEENRQRQAEEERLRQQER